MKTAKIFSVIFALLAVILIAGTVMLSFQSRNAPVQLLGTAESAAQRAEAVMDAICRGDYAAAGSMMYGQPELNASREDSEGYASVLWNAFIGSLSYEFQGGCYATDSGVARDVTVTALDISSVMEPLKARCQALLEQRAAAAGDSTEIYDENHNYQEAFVMEVLSEAAEQVLSEQTASASWDITLNLVCQDGQWWVVPEQALIQVLSGGMTEGG